jgi:hypothetical protein
VKDPRWYQLKDKAAKDRDLPNCAARCFINLIDHLAKKPKQKAGDPFVLSWRVVRHVTGGAERGVSKPQAYRYLRQLEKHRYIFATPRSYVRDFLLVKQSKNPAATKWYNIAIKPILEKGKVTKEMWAEIKQELAKVPPPKKKKSWEED